MNDAPPIPTRLGPESSPRRIPPRAHVNRAHAGCPRRTAFFCTALLLGASALPGCEDGPPPPDVETRADTADQAAHPTGAPTEKPRPTTQELLTGPTQQLQLRGIPFSVTVPRGWKLESRGGINILTGATPAGAVEIQVGRHPAPIPKHAEALIAGAKKDIATSEPDPLNLAEMRQYGSIEALEYRKVGKPTGNPAIDPEGRKIADTATPLKWKITAFIPSGRDTDLCELSFVDFTREQYEIDRELLQKVVESITYDPRATGG